MIGSYGWVAAGITAAVLSALLWNAERRLDNAQDDIVQLTFDVNTAVFANETVRETLEVCKLVNAFNANQRDAALLAAEIAVGQVEILETTLEDLIHAPIETTDTECRRLDEPLPDSLVRQLCISAAENCRPD